MKPFGSLMVAALIFVAPIVLHAEDSYIDQLARQVKNDMESGAFKEKVKPVDNSSTQQAAPSQPQQPRISKAEHEMNEAHLARFFGTLLGPDEFATDEFWEGPSLETTGSRLFGDSVRNPTGLDLFNTGHGQVRGIDTGYIRPWTINNNTLRDEINGNQFDNIRNSLQLLGYGNGDFRIERY